MTSFIFDTIQSKDVFRLVNYVPQSVYSSLVWYNCNNFTGYRVWREEIEDECSEIMEVISVSSTLSIA